MFFFTYKLLLGKSVSIIENIFVMNHIICYEANRLCARNFCAEPKTKLKINQLGFFKLYFLISLFYFSVF